MKRSIGVLVAGAMLIGIGIGEARASERPFYLGFRAGIGVGSQSPDPGETDGSRIGITAGGVLGYPVTPNVAIETGLLYELRGAKYSASTAKLDYLVIPAVARLSFGPAEGVQPFVLAGLDLGLLMKAESDPESEGPNVDIKDNLKSTDVSLRLGAGAKVPAGGYAFVLQLAYSLGLVNVLDVPDTDETIKNRTLTIAAGVDF